MAVLLSTAALPSTIIKLSVKSFSTSIIQEKPFTESHLFTGFSTGNDKDKQNRKVSFINLAVKNTQTTVETIQKVNGRITPRKGGGNPVLSEGRDEDENYGLICPGCGVFMQDKDPNLPGYYQKRKVIPIELSNGEEGIVGEFDGIDAGEEEEEEEEEFVDGIVGEFEELDVEEGDLGGGDEFHWDSGKWEDLLIKEEEEKLDLDGFTPAGVGYGNITDNTIEKARKKKVPKAEKKRMAREAQKEKEEVTVCARCHSLRNYGQVKNQKAENLIPDFDFDRLIATRLMKPIGNATATVVVMVVDCVDFDGSFPKRAAKSLFKALEGTRDDPKLSKKLPRLILVATKVDLLPSQIPPARLDRWVRHRARAGGAPKLSGVYMVSSHKDLGVRNLFSYIKELTGPRGNVWVIGAQNAGKSTLINAFAKKEGAKVTKLTEAPVPGTTLGILRVGGILSAKAKLFDTPGLLHPYLMSMRLNRDEQKMAGQALHVGGLARLDLSQASVQTIYVTIWASPNVSLHLGKIENAEDIWRNHVGVLLQPPIGTDRASQLGKWEEKEIKVSGMSWDVNSIDIAVAGLGWFSLGLKGEATLTLWTYDGIEITLREPLVLDRAPFLERPGFWLPKAITDAMGTQTKPEGKRRKKVKQVSQDFLSDVSV
uniref:CP-type G domain-containing protein n=1 Tax=Fagus sylvatica TaxID=28930 RepID=A0A2N9INF9_FAGSY